VSLVLYPGSFDPLHNGHLDVIEQAAALFGDVIVLAMYNPAKVDPLFELDVRRQMMAECLGDLAAVRVEFRSGLVVDAARELGVDFIVKGLRTTFDFEYEMQMAQTNEAVTGVRTVFLPAVSAHAFVSSTFIREIARYGGDVTALVPPPVARRLEERYQR
jgi:pantetheine-phosphate adenylyltransferase